MKRITAVIGAAMMALTLTACGGGKEKEVSVDAKKLAGDLLSTVTSDTLVEMSVDPSTVYFYSPDDVENVVAYASSGATACEVAVAQSKDASDAGEMEKLFQTRVDNQKELYASYNAAEADKLDDAIIKSAGTYTVLCVCDDVDKANELLKDYGF